MKMTWIQSAHPAQFKSAIEALEELSDVEIQRRRWNSTGEGEISSFVEAVQGLFTDSGLGPDLDKGRTGLDAPTVAILKALDAALAKISGYRAPDEIIVDPAMVDVRQLARTVIPWIRAQTAS